MKAIRVFIPILKKQLTIHNLLVLIIVSSPFLKQQKKHISPDLRTVDSPWWRHCRRWCRAAPHCLCRGAQQRWSENHKGWGFVTMWSTNIAMENHYLNRSSKDLSISMAHVHPFSIAMLVYWSGVTNNHDERTLTIYEAVTLPLPFLHPMNCEFCAKVWRPYPSSVCCTRSFFCWVHIPANKHLQTHKHHRYGKPI